MLSSPAASPFAERDIQVLNPFFWNTKAEIVRRIADAGCGDLIAQSFSCGSTRKATLASGRHCGTCTQCLDRRFGIVSAGCERLEPASNYVVELLRGAREPGVEAVTAESYIMAAHRWARSSEAGFLGAHGEMFRTLQYLGLPPGEAATRLHQLHVRHGAGIVAVLRDHMASHDPIGGRLAMADHSLLSMMQGPLAQDVDLRDPVEREAPAAEQAEQRNIRTIPRPIVMTVEQQPPRVQFTGNVTLDKRHAALLLALLPALQEGQRAGLDSAAYRYMHTNDLAASIGVSAASLRQYAMQLRMSLQSQYRKSFGATIELDDVFESRRWAGYRLNPNLQLGAAAVVPRLGLSG